MQSTIISGREIFYVDNNDPVIAYLKKGILFGESNYNLLSRLILNKNPDAHILDCGGHIGTFAVPAAKRHNVTVIEGAAQNIECLQKTFEGDPKVKVVPAIVAEKKKRCNFSETVGPFGWLVEDENGPFETTTIDNICNGLDISAVKLDIEGGEQAALVGATQTLDRCKPPILMEINGYCLGEKGELPQQLLGQVYNLDYIVFVIVGNKMYKVDPNAVFPFCVADVICIHRDNLPNYGNWDKIGPMDQYTINLIIAQNYQNSNDHCKKYFRSIGYSGEFI